GLSTTEGDGGPECQLNDGRWTCSAECYDRATEPPASTSAEPVAWRYTTQDINGDEWPWTYTESRPTENGGTIVQPLYTAPPASTRVELTEEMVERIAAVPALVTVCSDGNSDAQ